MKARDSFAAAPILYSMEDFDQYAPYTNFKNQVNLATGVMMMIGLGLVVNKLTK